MNWSRKTDGFQKFEAPQSSSILISQAPGSHLLTRHQYSAFENSAARPFNISLYQMLLKTQRVALLSYLRDLLIDLRRHLHRGTQPEYRKIYPRGSNEISPKGVR